MKKIVISVTNDLVTDQRVYKVCNTLFKLGNKVVLVGRLLKNSIPLQRPYKTHRMFLIFSKGPLFYAEYNLRLFFYLLFQRADILVSNDLDTLPANFLVSKISGIDLVYDSHEYFTGVPELNNRPVIRSIWKSIEKIILPNLKYIITVDYSIGKLYEDKYKKSINIVRNVPLTIKKDHWPTRVEMGLPADKKIIVIQGSINKDRGIEEAVLSFNYLDDMVLLLIGDGDVLPEIKRMVLEKRLTDKVIFKSRMAYIELMEHTRMADLGCTLEKGTNINYKFCLPNKLFDYIHAGIPVLCTNNIEVANIVNKYNIGMVIENQDPISISESIKKMLNNTEQIKNWKINLAKAAKELCWENEETELMKVYEKLL